MTAKEQMIRDTFADLDTWGLRLQEPWRPDPGTPLEADDLDWPPFPMSQVAVAGLASARDHLQAVRVHIDAQELFPFAQSTLLRTATLAAATTVWVLSPDDSKERIERARICVLEINDQHRKFLTDLQHLAPEPHEGTVKVAEHVTKRLGELRALRAADAQAKTFNSTDIIYDAAFAVWGTESLAVEARVEWRRGSGAAHGLMWAGLGQADTRMNAPTDTDGLAEFGVAGGIDRIANPYLLAYHLTKHGWKLLHDRSRRQ